ncbi:hypothetical protein C2E23DRAFT_862073 [Lenzites betulinus]|nr:hypothetical protein C2E23DRAFT_862073 [Lenzites betulinus]
MFTASTYRPHVLGKQMMEAKSNTSGSLDRCERHPRLYLENEEGTVIFRYQNTLFKVHRYFLKKHSDVFATMFDLPPLPGELPDGLSDEKPMVLPEARNVKAVDFERFLALFYPENDISGDLSTLDDWTSVLRIAHCYRFEEHEKLAIARLDHIAGPVDRLLLVREFDIREWAQRAYFDLVMRMEALTFDEAVRMDLADVVSIAELRQRARPSHPLPVDYVISMIARTMQEQQVPRSQ